jgi:hypothetical protein
LEPGLALPVATLALWAATVYAPTSVLECVPAGGKVGGYANGFIPATVDVQKIARIDYSVGGSIGANAIISPPTVQNQMVVPKFSGYARSGTLTASNFNLVNPSINVYPLTAGGMPIERVSDIELLTVYSYGSWDFVTTAADALFDDYLMSVQYSR